MLLTNDVNVSLFLSHFDEFLRAGDEYGIPEILIAKIDTITTSQIRIAQQEGYVNGKEMRDEQVETHLCVQK